MGGTFDPIHHGHLVAASEVAGEFDLDEVVFVPTGRPWQKAESSVSSPEHRYLMTVIATASNPRFTVSRVDIERNGPTFTVDTLRDLKRLRPEADLFFITGADVMGEILTWKGAEELWQLANFVGVTRPGHDLEAPVGSSGVNLLEVPAMAISSTDCRKRVAEHKPVWYLVPDGVVQYINKYGLYVAPGEDADVHSVGARSRTATAEAP
jgi:nicotinate-nucleotide adenylyltransferase